MPLKNESHADEKEDAIDKEVKGHEEKGAWTVEEEVAAAKVDIV